LLRKNSMSIKSKIAAIAAASLGMVLAHSSASRAETEDNSAPEKVTKIAVPIDVDEVFYSALPDEVLERAAGFGGTVHLAAGSAALATCTCMGPNCEGQSVKKPTYGGMRYEDRKVPPKGSTGPTVPPKPTQGNKNK
jgi:hypothetical protein